MADTTSTALTLVATTVDGSGFYRMSVDSTDAPTFLRTEISSYMDFPATGTETIDQTLKATDENPDAIDPSSDDYMWDDHGAEAGFGYRLHMYGDRIVLGGVVYAMVDTRQVEPEAVSAN